MGRSVAGAPTVLAGRPCAARPGTPTTRAPPAAAAPLTSRLLRVIEREGPPAKAGRSSTPASSTGTRSTPLWRLGGPSSVRRTPSVR